MTEDRDIKNLSIAIREKQREFDRTKLVLALREAELAELQARMNTAFAQRNLSKFDEPAPEGSALDPDWDDNLMMQE